MNRYFYWQRNVLGRWSPVLASDAPGKDAESRRKPTVTGLVTLSDRHSDWSLDDCAAEWPLPLTRREKQGE